MWLSLGPIPWPHLNSPHCNNDNTNMLKQLHLGRHTLLISMYQCSLIPQVPSWPHRWSANRTWVYGLGTNNTCWWVPCEWYLYSNWIEGVATVSLSWGSLGNLQLTNSTCSVFEERKSLLLLIWFVDCMLVLDENSNDQENLCVCTVRGVRAMLLPCAPYWLCNDLTLFVSEQ